MIIIKVKNYMTSTLFHVKIIFMALVGIYFIDGIFSC